ncbi:MAG: hypothetical protein SFV23_25355 [Planctomycetaceae bacterium]|nr:hypothetical protein [Planctomycetaceae bacterium]
MSWSLILLAVGQVDTGAPAATVVRAGSYYSTQPQWNQLLQVRNQQDGAPRLAPSPPAEEALVPAPAPAPAPLVAAPISEPAPSPLGSYEADVQRAPCCSPAGNCLTSACPGGACMSPGCPHCHASCDEDDTKICKLSSTCDLYPHYAYYPRYHGYYYFRPYNYTMIAEHQAFAQCIGLDPRTPYSLANFNAIYSTFPIQFTPARSPVGTALPHGSGLPQLEDLLEKPAP